MKTLIECIPNISEGRRPEVVAAIRDAALGASRDVLLLDSTSDPDHNRSVLTFLGDGPALVDAMTAPPRPITAAPIQSVERSTARAPGPSRRNSTTGEGRPGACCTS